MKYAYIENGVVIDRVGNDPCQLFRQEYARLFIECPDDVDNFWLYDGNEFTAPPATPAAIPTLTMRQARLALLVNNLLSQVEAAITTAEHRIWWDYSTTVERNNPLVCGVLDSLGMSANEIDALFVEAARLQLSCRLNLGCWKTDIKPFLDFDGFN